MAKWRDTTSCVWRIAPPHCSQQLFFHFAAFVAAAGGRHWHFLPGTPRARSLSQTLAFAHNELSNPVCCACASSVFCTENGDVCVVVVVGYHQESGERRAFYYCTPKLNEVLFLQVILPRNSFQRWIKVKEEGAMRWSCLFSLLFHIQWHWQSTVNTIAFKKLNASRKKVFFKLQIFTDWLWGEITSNAIEASWNRQYF